MYTTYYALTDQQYRRLIRLRLIAFVALIALGGIVFAFVELLGLPHGLEPTSWPLAPVDWYGWVLAMLLVGVVVAGVMLLYALQQLYIDKKVRKKSTGIGGVAYPMTAAMLVLVLFAVLLAGKLLFLIAWKVPSTGWPRGLIWSQWCQDKIEQVGFSEDGQLIRARLKSGAIRSWLIGSDLERSTPAGASLGPVSSPPLADTKLDDPTITLAAGPTVLECRRNNYRIKMLHGPEEKKRDLTGDISVISAVALSGDGLLALSGGLNGAIRVFELPSPDGRGALLGSHDGPVHALAISADKLSAISGGQDTKVRIWDMAAGKERRLLEGGHRSAVKHVALSADGKRAVTASEEPNVLCVWNVDSGKILGQYEWKTSPLGPSVISMSPDGHYALTTEGETLHLWRLPR